MKQKAKRRSWLVLLFAVIAVFLSLQGATVSGTQKKSQGPRVSNRIGCFRDQKELQVFLEKEKQTTVRVNEANHYAIWLVGKTKHKNPVLIFHRLNFEKTTRCKEQKGSYLYVRTNEYDIFDFERKLSVP
ncbi:MAG: hypothetical protein A3I07_04545 [Candidatus Doudnabacteria bacterium RIFCSPLOWO2_02_FULL_42_9]|uniref:Uncharacterized protein n=1 Tax=Candidatus Doudnabacteria bacterium RIFCSPHIGHO2_01_FULL_41_86 TaxID=1817821 RepID=A0A1F5N9E0_9BACT|nr:MAG: hypothetical protein A2717_01945 [Candidatus Doudnabacteria bacterium RIFCSPHIGHO2_01_FULL_41_86]OGE85326.1 MAG: hypothetical protein A3E28_01515 [Candidatus Doudnabacteria bacterium RIFCSPHIGHO2_12_FULL_42_22]OGE86864.1 MAG: hypothetical protein A3C49_02350 [Candidatus Doudnabacteria bacterium RIFCSPHIGHO2_02_FULL_42_25]OGE92463.1 MAG: hypothetical protein A2895_02505 [Candidatus Doudnabacteria bacterium RIFCSPLOWO2_01_FULL_42_60]OGE93833.1 MAG: hypothetical protein A3K08_02300 [Candid